MAVSLIIRAGGPVNDMNGSQCNRCGCSLGAGEPSYEVAVKVRSFFDGVIPELTEEQSGDDLSRIVAEMSAYTEEELTRQVYEDDVFIMCPSCKEEFMEDVYSHIRPKASPEKGRAHLIH